MNKLLKRQLNKYLGGEENLPENMLRFLQTVSDSYDHYEKDRRLLERSIEISSMELKELNGKLKRETEEESKEVFKQLKESLVLINEDNEEIIPSDLDYQKLSHLAGIVKGETEKRRIAEIELKNSEYRFRSLIENSADAIMIVNDRSEPVYLSTSVTRILGYKPEDVTNIPIYNFFHPNDFEELKDLFKRVYTNPERTYTTEYRVRKKEGNYIWVEGTSTNMLHIDAVNGVVINFRDIDDRKKAKDKLEATNRELRKSNSELDKFVYSVSHDLRAPLSSMLGVIDLIESEVTSEEMAVDVNHLKSSINRLDGFIKDILDYSRNTRTKVEAAEINFEDKLQEISQNLKYMNRTGGGPSIKIKVDGDTPFYSDNLRIGMILNNVISNAIRYSDPAKENCYVDVEVEVSEHNAELTISDNGIGIEEENIGKLFEMFYRVSKKSVGSGLGLYIVKEAVEKMQGRIAVESKLGSGTTFKITLPNQLGSINSQKLAYV